MTRFTAIFDACVLYPAPIRDLLLELAQTELFRARWTNRIHDEWIRALLESRPDLSRERLYRTRELMNQSVPDCLITDYEELISSLTLPDLDDRHVLAAAIKGRADVIVTLNVRDFPAPALAAFGIEAQHPDEFIVHHFHLSQVAVCQAAKAVRGRLTRPSKTVDSTYPRTRRVGRTRH